jgi:hypothetical protein
MRGNHAAYLRVQTGKKVQQLQEFHEFLPQLI